MAFEQLRNLDPHRVEHMDIYSNILFVHDDKARLSTLAHECIKIDKYRPETCCVIGMFLDSIGVVITVSGNYYSLKGEHEKAIQSFQRALKLNRNYLAAWTLIGHEYLEMGSTNAASEAYRRAIGTIIWRVNRSNSIDINPRDYRAWFGLGQVYEMLRMNYYAIYYYQRATVLR